MLLLVAWFQVAMGLVSAPSVYMRDTFGAITWLNSGVTMSIVFSAVGIAFCAPTGMDGRVRIPSTTSHCVLGTKHDAGRIDRTRGGDAGRRLVDDIVDGRLLVGADVDG